MSTKKTTASSNAKKTIAYHVSAQQKQSTYTVTRKLSTGTSVSFSKKAPHYVVEGKHLISYGK